MYIVIKGDPVDGFKFIGPFRTHGDAERYMDHNDDDTMWLYELQPPYGREG